MATEFADGVIVGADSRTSTGTYVANRVTDKLTKVSDLIYCCRSGSAADTQAIADAVSYSLNYNEVQTGKAPLVREAASEFQKFCYEYRYKDVLEPGKSVYLKPILLCPFPVIRWLPESLLQGTMTSWAVKCTRCLWAE